jgi:hypothetical protein
VGDLLVGDEGCGDERIEITAIGASCVLARRTGRPDELPHESGWYLSARCWGKA